MSMHDHSVKKQTNISDAHHQQEEQQSAGFDTIQQSIQNPHKETLTPSAILQLQRTIGNRRTINLLRQQSVTPAQSALLIQRQKVDVGFDKVNTANAGDVIRTDGLGNCIAVIAHFSGPGQNRVAMAHYNTLNANLHLTRLEATVAPLRALREALEAKNPGGANVEFRVVLGDAWGTKPPDNRMLMQLKQAIGQVFQVEPEGKAGVRAEYAVDTKTMTVIGGVELVRLKEEGAAIDDVAAASGEGLVYPPMLFQ